MSLSVTKARKKKITTMDNFPIHSETFSSFLTTRMERIASSEIKASIGNPDGLAHWTMPKDVSNRLVARSVNLTVVRAWHNIYQTMR